MVKRAARALPALLLALFALEAHADSRSIDGWGRITVFGGYRYTPNGYFADRTAAAGAPMPNPSPGGPQGGASFGYGAFPFLEISIDLLVGYEQVELEGYEPFSSVQYGGLLGARFTKMDVLFTGFAPYAGLQFGPLLSSVSSSSAPQPEKVLGGISVNGGFTWRFAERFGISLDVRWLFARHYVDAVGVGMNVGGLWVSAGFTIFFPPQPKQDLDVPGF